MRALAQKLGLRINIIEGVRCSPGFVGVSIAHIRAVSSNGIKPPFLVLENDVDVERWFSPIVEVPDDADGFYLGVSSCGVVKVPSKKGGKLDHVGCEYAAIFLPFSEQVVRVVNMTSAHAILFLSEQFRAAYVRARMKAMVDRFVPGDIVVTEIQPKFNLYALKMPPFFQSDAIQGENAGGVATERFTRVQAKVRPVNSCILAPYGDDIYELKLVANRDNKFEWQSL